MLVLCGLWMLFYIVPVGETIAAPENSTQMHYMVLEVEEGVLRNITEKLLNQDYHHDDFTLTNITMTTECDVDPVQDQRTCRCREGFEWSPASCSETKCCRNQICKNPLYNCNSKQTVLLKGSVSLDISYQGCLDDVKTVPYQSCHGNLTKKMESVFSLFHGFDSLRITAYRVGSVFADFEVVVVSDVNPSLVHQMSEKLAQELNATLSLETTGITQLQVPQEPLEQNSDTALHCSFAGFSDGSSLVQKWQLLNHKDETKDIFNGTGSTITTTITEATMESTLSLTQLSHHWTGTYSCCFIQKDPGVLIRHLASSHMYVCVSPEVSIRTDPQFPRCRSPPGLLALTVYCEIPDTYEDFTVTWSKENIKTAVQPQPEERKFGVLVFSARTFVDCDSSQPPPKIICHLKNRCQQETKAIAEVHYLRDPYCRSDGVWQDTPVNQTAEVRCSNSVGIRKRLCKNPVNPEWALEQTNCVDQGLQDVLDNSIVSDIGLGRLEKNADDVFKKLQNMTNNTKAFNSVPNLKTSVTVISTMNTKLSNLSNPTTVNNFLLSASNILEQPLANSWELSSKDTKTPLAAEYLIAVERLIGNANVTHPDTQNNLQVRSCHGASCSNKVFNNNVTASTRRGAAITTTGFLNLANFLPNDREPNYSLNSIVISTTARAESAAGGGAGKAQGGAQGSAQGGAQGGAQEGAQEGAGVGEVDIIIDFALIGPRPRNHALMCVFWNTNNSRWSDEGCELQSEGRCRCRHLSSFAVLMSKAPLEVPYLTQITYAGLSVSIVSLVAFLVVELVIWRDVVKTDTLHMRHCAHVHISVCLLVADVCFLAAALPGELSAVWLLTFVVLQHFCYLAMFFWTLCLSCVLLHKTVYVSLRGAGRTAYTRFSLLLGYVSPLLIVVVTFLANDGADGRYYSKETRWLVYGGLLKGSIFTFIIPVCIIVFINLFFMVLVILKLLQSAAAQPTADPEKNSVKTVIRSVVLLTPVFGLTWVFGFFIILFDLTKGPEAYAANYLFTIMNAFQGLYIFLTACLCDRRVRDGLRRYFSKKSAEKSISSSVSQSSLKKK